MKQFACNLQEMRNRTCISRSQQGVLNCNIQIQLEVGNNICFAWFSLRLCFSVVPYPRSVHVYNCTAVPLLSTRPVTPGLVTVFSTPPATMALVKVFCTVILAAKCHPLKHSDLCRLLC